MRSALLPQRAKASATDWQRFLQELQRELWADTKDSSREGGS